MGKKRRQPSLPRVHSLLNRYNQQTGRHLASIEIEDPWNDGTSWDKKRGVYVCPNGKLLPWNEPHLQPRFRCMGRARPVRIRSFGFRAWAALRIDLRHMALRSRHCRSRSCYAGIGEDPWLTVRTSPSKPCASAVSDNGATASKNGHRSGAFSSVLEQFRGVAWHPSKRSVPT